jgi:hypothetical protein
MTRLQDDDIRAMLEARAARAPEPRIEGLPRSTERVAGPVTARRLAMSVPLAALGVVLVLVVGAVGIGRLGDSPAASRETASVGTQTKTSAPGDEWSYQQLADALAAGRLSDGSVVLLRGAIEQAPCDAIRLAACLDVRIRGLDAVDISSDLPLPFEQLLLEGGNHARDALMALRVEGPRLRFLGWPDRDPAEPVALDELLTPPDSPATLVPVSGWLGGPVPAAFCPPMGPTDPNEESICTGRPAVVATTADAAMDVPAPPDAVRVETTMRVDPDPAPGPVLLSRSGGSCIQMSADAWTTCDGPRFQPWTARAALGATPVIRVAAPTDAAGATPAVSIAADGRMELPAFREALRSGALDGRVVEVTGEAFVSMSICDAAAGVDCRPVSSWGIEGLEDVGGSPLTQLPCLTPCPAGAPSEGPFLFVARGTTLTYLGVTRGDLDAPVDPTDEAVRQSLLAGHAGHWVYPVDGWLTADGALRLSDLPRATDESYEASMSVRRPDDPVGIDPDDAVVAGPFLVAPAHRENPCAPTTRGCFVATYPIVLGRYDPSRVVRVSLE